MPCSFLLLCCPCHDTFNQLLIVTNKTCVVSLGLCLQIHFSFSYTSIRFWIQKDKIPSRLTLWKSPGMLVKCLSKGKINSKMEGDNFKPSIQLSKILNVIALRFHKAYTLSQAYVAGIHISLSWTSFKTCCSMKYLLIKSSVAQNIPLHST